MIDKGQEKLAFHERAESLRFLVPTAQGVVAAYLPVSSWWASHGGVADDISLKDIYLTHRDSINASVERRVRAGARTPVILMAADL